MDNEHTIKGIAPTKEFKRDCAKLGVEIITSKEWGEVFFCLRRGKTLPVQYKDHALKNNWKGYRDCHIFSDLVLIYKIENNILYLIRVSSHSDIFG